MSFLFVNPFYSLLWASFILIILASLGMVLSIGRGQRLTAINEMRIYVQLEARERLSNWQQFYHNEKENQLIRSMGLPISAAKLKVIRDVAAGTVLLVTLLRYVLTHGSLLFGLVLTVLIYSCLWPSVKNFSIFSNVIGPLLQKIRRYRVTRETHVLLLLLRNEVQETQKRSVLSLIQKYQSYFKVIKQDLLILEHEWGRGKDIALTQMLERHPKNDEIAYLASMLRDMDSVEYEDLDKMLKENSETLNKKQQSSFEARENDLNQILFMINLGGTALALLWFVIAMFMWSYSFDTNF
ncbi:hypothetical protein [Cohnella sp. AR92]|uniref:hypothetical protein n=1 Tax=Cohnella sp. AR92 TaxID=648716 RepID=UPI000F8D17F8|nr:hypothetical protein [Cohnella sp. AR92]RUS44943.1 hypothetical protein ELR57_22060 [Cohnella sp. AR92]